MSLILTGKYRTRSYWYFIRNRALRLYPLFFIFSLVAAIAALWFHRQPYRAFIDYGPGLHPLTWLVIIVSNIFMVGQDVFLFLQINPATGVMTLAPSFDVIVPMQSFQFLATSWTLGVEIWFYFLAPYLVRLRFRSIFLIAITSVLLRAILWFGFDLREDPWTYRFFPTELVFFLVGICAHRVYRRSKVYSFNPWLPFGAWAAVLFLTCFGSFLPFSPAINAVLFLLIISSALPLIFLATKDWRIDRVIGELSYPLYLSHLLVLGVVGALNVHVALFLTFLVAVIVVQLIDIPIMRWKTRDLPDEIQTTV